MLPIEERVEQHTDEIVAADLLSLAQVRAHSLRLGVVADEHDVQVPVVVREVRGGALRRRDAVSRLALLEIADRRFGLARRSVEELLERRRARHAWDANRGGLSGGRLGGKRDQKRAAERSKHLADRNTMAS